MKMIIYFILLTCCLAACEPGYRADIVNRTGHELVLEIQFDKIALDSIWNGMSYNEFLKTYPNYIGIRNIKFDSLKLISVYKIQPFSSFPLESGIGNEPDYKIFKEIKIFYKDTTHLRNRQEIIKAFPKMEKGTWQLKIE